MSVEAVRRAPLGTLVHIDMGRNYVPGLRSAEAEGSLPILGAERRSTHDPQLDHVRSSSLGGRDVVVGPGDLVIELNVPIGPPMLVEQTSVLSLRHVRLRPMKGSVVTTEWLFVWASSSDFRQQVASRARSLRSRITLQELRSFSVPLARREQQDAAFASLQKTLEATRLGQRQIDLLTDLREAIVDRAVALIVDEDRGA